MSNSKLQPKPFRRMSRAEAAAEGFNWSTALTVEVSKYDQADYTRKMRKYFTTPTMTVGEFKEIVCESWSLDRERSEFIVDGDVMRDEKRLTEYQQIFRKTEDNRHRVYVQERPRVYLPPLEEMLKVELKDEDDEDEEKPKLADLVPDRPTLATFEAAINTPQFVHLFENPQKLARLVKLYQRPDETIEKTELEAKIESNPAFLRRAYAIAREELVVEGLEQAVASMKAELAVLEKGLRGQTADQQYMIPLVRNLIAQKTTALAEKEATLAARTANLNEKADIFWQTVEQYRVPSSRVATRSNPGPPLPDSSTGPIILPRIGFAELEKMIGELQVTDQVTLFDVWGSEEGRDFLKRLVKDRQLLQLCVPRAADAEEPDLVGLQRAIGQFIEKIDQPQFRAVCEHIAAKCHVWMRLDKAKRQREQQEQQNLIQGDSDSADGGDY